MRLIENTFPEGDILARILALIRDGVEEARTTPPSALRRVAYEATPLRFQTGMPSLRALSARLRGNAGAGEDNEADRHGFQHLIVALERRRLGVTCPIGLEDDLRDLASFGPAGGDALGASWASRHASAPCRGAWRAALSRRSRTAKRR